MAAAEPRPESLRTEDIPSPAVAPMGVDDKGSVFEDAPEGGSRAWLVAAGAGFISFSSLGYANSVGVFQEYYLSHQLKGQSPDDVAWIGSIAAFLQFVVGAVSGPLFDRYGALVSLVHAPDLTMSAYSRTDQSTGSSPLGFLHHDDKSL